MGRCQVWNQDIVQRDLLAQLPAVDQEVAAKIEKGEPVVAPGVPENYPDAKELVTNE